MNSHLLNVRSSSLRSSRRQFLDISTRAALATASASALSMLADPVDATTQDRSISEFLAAQGTFCVPDGGGGCLLFVPPAPNFIGWNEKIVDPRHIKFAGVDYAGLANAALGNVFGTSMRGSVTERPLADGRAEVHVLLFTDRANTWVIDLDATANILAQIASKPTLFGKRPGAAGLPALGSCTLQVKFTQGAPGAPLPDLLQLQNAPQPGQSLDFIGFQTTAFGPLTTEFGMVNGTPGRCTIRQTGLLETALRVSPRSRVALDAFPAELIELRLVGR